MAKDKDEHETENKVAGTITAVRPPPKGEIDITDLIQQIGQGVFFADCNDALGKVVAQLMEIWDAETREASGSIDIKIKLQTMKGAVVPTCSVTAKLPATKPVSGLAFGDSDGKLYSKDPNQKGFDFR